MLIGSSRSRVKWLLFYILPPLPPPPPPSPRTSSGTRGGPSLARLHSKAVGAANEDELQLGQHHQQNTLLGCHRHSAVFPPRKCPRAITYSTFVGGETCGCEFTWRGDRAEELNWSDLGSEWDFLKNIFFLFFSLELCLCLTAFNQITFLFSFFYHWCACLSLPTWELLFKAFWSGWALAVCHQSSAFH